MDLPLPRVKSADGINDFLQKCSIVLPNGQFALLKPLPAFKKVLVEVDPQNSARNKYGIANLILPAGTIVNWAQSGFEGKLRASKAFCWNIIALNKKHTEKSRGYSVYDHSFQYVSLERSGFSFQETIKQAKHLNDEDRSRVFLVYLVKPLGGWSNHGGFDMGSTKQCSSGIHFFFDLKKAIGYQY